MAAARMSSKRETESASKAEDMPVSLYWWGFEGMDETEDNKWLSVVESDSVADCLELSRLPS